jgi:hypothetical protein
MRRWHIAHAPDVAGGQVPSPAGGQDVPEELLRTETCRRLQVGVHDRLPAGLVVPVVSRTS